MLYSVFQYLKEIGVPGAGVFQYISFRAGLAMIISLITATIIGRHIIEKLQKKQIGEIVRDLGLEGQLQKKGTPTMGGLIIIFSIMLPVLLLNQLDNIYVLLMIVSTLGFGALGFADDYIKVYKKNKEGLAGKYKIIGQVVIGFIVAIGLWWANGGGNSTPTTVIPFLKNHEFNYSNLVSWMDGFLSYDTIYWLSWVVYALIIVFIITAVSNGANLTDGLDGLATGTSAIIGTTLGIIAYVSSHAEYAHYLNITYIAGSSELVIYLAAFIGATIGFLWYNAFPAQVFMGDTGSLMLGGVIGVIAVMIKVELLLPILCGIFLVESLSVIIQRGYFKYTKRKFGEGRRVFLMAPLHHHYQKKKYHEAKIVIRFCLIGIILAVLTLVTLKIR